MYKMQVEGMRDLFFQKITYKEISTLIQAIYASVILSNQPNDFVKKNGISPRIFKEHVISVAVTEVQKNFYKIYFFE